MQLIHAQEIIDRKRYDTETATLIADDVYWDGSNMERGGTNTWLFRTPKGAYFSRFQTQWEGSEDAITPLSLDEAEELYYRLREKHLDFEDAFPGLEVEDA